MYASTTQQITISVITLKNQNQLTPSEANSHSAGTEINLVWNPDIQ